MTVSVWDGAQSLGWAEDFQDQCTAQDADLVPLRIATVHRARATAFGPSGQVRLTLPAKMGTNDLAVGDWVLAEARDWLLGRRLVRRTLLERRVESAHIPQLIAANVDTLFIVTSCNADFNPARLERYLALANEAGTEPVILLTKADLAGADEAARYAATAATLQRGLPVVVMDARAAEAVAQLAQWCVPGQTVALVGSSGVGKSTLLNSLAGADQAAPQETGAVREGDAKGRHTTTARSLHPVAGGGWVIDTPGMRTLHVSDVAEGLGQLFAEITELAPLCRFRDCTHGHEPGCAVLAAVAAGTIDAARVDRWRKLRDENVSNTPVESGPKGNRQLKPRAGRR